MAKSKQKQDSKIMFIRIMNIIVWSLIFAAMLLFDQARPETKTILDSRYSKEIRDTWDYTYAALSMWTFIASAISSSIGLLVNVFFLGNRKYHISYGLIIGFLFSIGAAIAYMIILLG